MDDELLDQDRKIVLVNLEALRIARIAESMRPSPERVASVMASLGFDNHGGRTGSAVGRAKGGRISGPGLPDRRAGAGLLRHVWLALSVVVAVAGIGVGVVGWRDSRLEAEAAKATQLERSALQGENSELRAELDVLRSSLTAGPRVAAELQPAASKAMSGGIRSIRVWNPDRDSALLLLTDERQTTVRPGAAYFGPGDFGPFNVKADMSTWVTVVIPSRPLTETQRLEGVHVTAGDPTESVRAQLKALGIEVIWSRTTVVRPSP